MCSIDANPFDRTPQQCRQWHTLRFRRRHHPWLPTLNNHWPVSPCNLAAEWRSIIDAIEMIRVIEDWIGCPPTDHRIDPAIVGWPIMLLCVPVLPPALANRAPAQVSAAVGRHLWNQQGCRVRKLADPVSPTLFLTLISDWAEKSSNWFKSRSRGGLAVGLATPPTPDRWLRPICPDEFTPMNSL